MGTFIFPIHISLAEEYDPLGATNYTSGNVAPIYQTIRIGYQETAVFIFTSSRVTIILCFACFAFNSSLTPLSLPIYLFPYGN